MFQPTSTAYLATTASTIASASALRLVRLAVGRAEARQMGAPSVGHRRR